MTKEEILVLFSKISANLDDDFQLLLSEKPLLAHYTSTEALESILRNNEIWFSNPLFMNDLEEMRLGMRIGEDLITESEELAKACGSEVRLENFQYSFSHYFSEFELQHAFDVYVFCLTEHDQDDNDGLLSMWRGYGRNGDGAALVFNTSFVVEQAASPLFITKVRYVSAEKRMVWLKNLLDRYCEAMHNSFIDDDMLYLVAFQFFQVVKVFALIFKYKGFLEEREWRIIYMPDRDPQGHLKDRFGYVIGSRGVEPKLKLKLEPLPTDSVQTWTFESILDRIILGPSVSSPLAQSSVQRMLEKIGKPEFREKVVPSRIPLRPT